MKPILIALSLSLCTSVAMASQNQLNDAVIILRAELNQKIVKLQTASESCQDGFDGIGGLTTMNTIKPASCNDVRTLRAEVLELNRKINAILTYEAVERSNV
jgi:hypothetical protein